MATPSVLQLLCIISLFPFTHCNPILNKVIDSIERYVQYTLNDTDDFDLYNLYSLKVVEGTTQHLLSERDEEYILPRLTSLQDDIAKLRALTIHKFPEDVVRERWRLINDAWVPPKVYRLIAEEYRWKRTAGVDGSGKLSQELGKCMQEVVSRKRMVPSSQHRVSKKCISRDAMLIKNGDRNLHLQLMFFLYTEMWGFKEFVNGELMKLKIMGGIKEVQLEMCTNAFFELRKIVKKGKLDNYETVQVYADHAFYCGAMGFMQFLHTDFLDQLLAYQRPNGCFASLRHEECSQHFSAALVPVLAMYMLLAAEPGSAAHQQHVNISGINYIKDGIPVPAHIVEDINGPMRQLGGPPRVPMQQGGAGWMPGFPSPGQLGVGFVLVLSLGTVAVLCWIRRVRTADGGWRVLPDKHTKKH